MIDALAVEPTWPKVVFAARDVVRRQYVPALWSAGFDVVELRDCASLVDELLAGPDDDDNPRDVELLVVHGDLSDCLARSGVLEALRPLPPVIWLAAGGAGEPHVVQRLRVVKVVFAGCAPLELVEAARRVVWAPSDSAG